MTYNKELHNNFNEREKYKLNLLPYDYFVELEKLDFDNLSNGDRFYLQDFGIFTTDFLEDEFAIRIRVPAGRVSIEQFSHIADIVKEYDLTIILTARGGMQLHEIYADDVLAIWRAFNSLGLTTWQSFGDNIRNIVSDVYDGMGKYAEIEVYDIVQEMQDFILQNPRYVGMLPRRVSIGISGNSANVTSFFANDIYFALAKKENIYGFNVYMGGKNSTIAKDANIFLQKDEVIEFFKAFVETFYLHGSRFSRSRNRLFYLIKDIGLDALKKLLQNEYKKEFQSAGKIQYEKVLFSQTELLKDGSYSFCYPSDFGRLRADEMQKIATFAKENNAEIRIGIDQNIYLLHLRDNTPPFTSTIKSTSVLACAGSLCSYSFWNIKDETSYLPLSKIDEHKIQVGFSGCNKGCGRHMHVDIGLIGLKTNRFGATEGGAQVYLGAGHSDGSSVARMIFTMVPFVHLNDTLMLIINIYEQSNANDFEEFSNLILNKFSPEFLSLWFLANLSTKQTLNFPKHKKTSLDFSDEKKELLSTFIDFDFMDSMEKNFLDAIKNLSRKLWTVEGKDPTYTPPMKRVNFR